MNGSTSGPDLFNRLADEFANRWRQGEQPPLAEYAEKYPELASQIRELFPMLMALEQMDASAEPAAGRPRRATAQALASPTASANT